MRILHVLDHSIPLHSGYTFRTLSILREQRRLGWETVQLTAPKHGPGSMVKETVDGFEFHRTPTATKAGYLRQMQLTAARIIHVARQEKVDIIHAHSPVLNALPALWARRSLGLPVVYEVRAFWEDAAVDHGTTSEGSLRYRITRAMETFALKRADQITTICAGLKTDMQARGIAGNRITEIPNAVDVANFEFGRAADPALQARLGLSGCTVFGFAGSFYYYEGLALLVEAFGRLAAGRPDARLLLVGGGPQESALKEQVAQAGLDGKVIFTGRVPHSEVQRYYELIDVLVYPRLPMRLTELVTPLKPLEAMAQGRIFVASDVGGHKELVRDGQTGLLCKAGDVAALVAALMGALQRRDQWPSLRQQARHFVEEERTWVRSVARYGEVYRNALLKRGQPLPVGLVA